jgi:hypothetical protein
MFMFMVEKPSAKLSGITLETSRVQRDAVQEVTNAAEPRFRRFEGHTTDQPVHLIPQTQQIIREVTAVLAGDSSNQRFLRQGDPPVPSLRNLCVLCASAFLLLLPAKFTAEAQRRRDIAENTFRLRHYQNPSLLAKRRGSA